MISSDMNAYKEILIAMTLSTEEGNINHISV